MVEATAYVCERHEWTEESEDDDKNDPDTARLNDVAPGKICDSQIANRKSFQAPATIRTRLSALGPERELLHRSQGHRRE